MSKKKFAPKVYPIDRDMSKVWFVKYLDDKGRYRKLYGKLSHLTTLQQRVDEANRLIKIAETPKQRAVNKKNDLISDLSELLEYKRPFMRKKSYESYSSIISVFATWYRIEHAKKSTLQYADYIRHLYDKNLHKNTIRNKCIVLKGLVNELIKNGKYKENPFAKFVVKKVKSQSKLPFTSNLVTTIKKHMLDSDPQLWDAVEFLYYLYLRPNEVRQIKVGDILFDEGKIFLSGATVKDGDVIYKAIPKALLPHLDKYKTYNRNFYIFGKNGKPGEVMLSRDNLSKRNREVLKKLNISSRYSFYSWVHTGIKNAAMSGIPHKQLQLQKGHADLKMFDEYLKDLGVDDCVQLVADFPAI